jgi:molybdopterin-containing oxidoreductase family membrane subunit
MERNTLRPASPAWIASFAVALIALAVGIVAVSHLLVTGVGVWGLNRSVGWAYDITNFVFWIGIGHAGTLISAILLLLRQGWRTGVNRAAEMMTLIAIVCAAVFPIIHLGRPWLFYWMLPVPNGRGPLWINFNSPLTWDVVAITTYFTVSAIFCYVGLLPDLGLMRDMAQGRRRRILQWISLGWRGSAREWRAHASASVALAAIATPLVISVHSVVSFDFAVTVVPGWHATIFPPYFVVGAIFSGMAMVLALSIVMRSTMQLQRYVTSTHIEAMCRIMLAMSCLLGFAYLVETATALGAAHETERGLASSRLSGPLAALFWSVVGCNVVVPQLLWWKSVRRNLGVLFAIAVIANVGMWLERFLIIVGSLERDYLPSAWTDYLPTATEIATLVGSFGLFFTLFLLFCRFLPVVSASEAKATLVHRLERRGAAP